MKKRLLAMLLMAVMVICMTACGGGGDADSGEAAEKTFKVGINNWGQANFFARQGKASLEDELAKLGCEVVSTVTDNASDRTDAIESMVQQGCDAIIIEEGDINEVEAAIKEAKEAGIIIGSMDAGTNDYVDIYVSSDNENLGKTSAEQMIDAIGGKGNIVEIINDAGSMIRIRKEAMHSAIEGTDIKVTDSITYAWPDYYPDVKSKMEAILQAHPNPGDIVAVYATFDGAGIAAYDAVKEAGLQDSIVIVGIDGDPDAYTKMREENSNYLCTIAQDPDGIARKCCQEVVKLLNGETIEQQTVLIPGILITKDNIPEDQ